MNSFVMLAPRRIFDSCWSFGGLTEDRSTTIYAEVLVGVWAGPSGQPHIDRAGLQTEHITLTEGLQSKELGTHFCAP